MNTLVKNSLKPSYIIFVGFKLNGVPHRKGGPAVEWSDGDKYWWLNGIKYSEEVYWKVLNEYSR